MSIAAYCRRPVCTATADETLRVAAQRMQKQSVGSLVVTGDEGVVGILTDRDVALHVARAGKGASRSVIGDVMSGSPICVDAALPVEEALARLRRERVRRLPVLEEGEQLVGIVSVDDWVRLLSQEISGLGEVLLAQLPAGSPRPLGREEPGASPRLAALHYAGEVASVPSDASIVTVAETMEDRVVGSVVVVDEQGRAAGLVTDRDVALRVVAADLDPVRTQASAVMSAPLIAVAPGDPLEEVVARMRTSGVRRILVLEDGRPVGIVSFDDLLVTFGLELGQLADCVSGEIRAARTRSQLVRMRDRVRHELEEGFEGVASQAREFGEQVFGALGRELEQLGDRVLGSLRGGARSRRGGSVAERMQTDVGTCTPDDTLVRAAQILWERDCGCVPVVAADGSGRLAGIVTDRDVCMAAYTSGRRLAELPVRLAMSARVHACRPDESLSDAEERMRAERVRRLPVVDEAGRLCGILSLADLARGTEEPGPAAALRAEEVGRTLGEICQPRGEPGAPGR